jgi:hypothetical protein
MGAETCRATVTLPFKADQSTENNGEEQSEGDDQRR